MCRAHWARLRLTNDLTVSVLVARSVRVCKATEPVPSFEQMTNGLDTTGCWSCRSFALKRSEIPIRDSNAEARLSSGFDMRFANASYGCIKLRQRL